MDSYTTERRELIILGKELRFKWRRLAIKALFHDPRITNGHRITILEYYTRLMGRAFLGLGISY